MPMPARKTIAVSGSWRASTASCESSRRALNVSFGSTRTVTARRHHSRSSEAAGRSACVLMRLAYWGAPGSRPLHRAPAPGRLRERGLDLPAPPQTDERGEPDAAGASLRPDQDRQAAGSEPVLAAPDRLGGCGGEGG